MPGTPSMPLPPTVISACPAAADSALTGYLSSVRRAEISVPGAVGVGERAHEHRDRAPRHRDQRARVQHLRAVIRQLRRLAQVQLRDDAGVGDDARVGGEQARDVLPQRHLARRQRAPEQRRRQVGAAAAQRRHRALLAAASLSSSILALPMKPGTTGILPAATSGASLLRAAMSVSGRFGDAPPNGPSVNTISVASTYVGRRPGRRQPGREHLRRQPFAAADDEVARARRQLLERGQAAQHAASSSNERSISAAAPRRARLAAATASGQDVAVARAQRRDVVAAPRPRRRRPRGSPAPATHRSPRPAPTRPPPRSRSALDDADTACRKAAPSPSDAPPNL